METQTKKLFRTALIALPLFSLAACGQASTETRGDESVGLIAMAPPATDSPAAYRTGMAPAPPIAQIPDQVLRDPAERFALMERLRTQVVHRTRQVPDARWYNELRPALRRQLRDAGLAAGDVDFLLEEIDQARPRG